MADDEATVPRAEVAARAAARGAPYSDSQLQRWTDATLAPPSRPMPNSLERGYSEAQAEQILRVAAIAVEIESKRPEHREIAFQLAFQGFAAPPELVLEFLEEAINVIQSQMKRLLTNRGNRCSDSPTFVDVVSGLLTDWVFHTIRQKRSEASLSAELLRDVFALLVSAMFSRSEAALLKLFESFIRQCFPNAAPDAPATLWKLLHEAFDLFRLDEKSGLVRAVRAAAPVPHLATRAAQDAGMFLTLAAQVIPACYKATTENTGGLCTEEDCRFFNRYFPPITAAVLMTFAADTEAQKRIQNVRDGDVADAVSDLHAIKALAADLGRKIVGLTAAPGEDTR